jgi:hypothetical protein
MAEDDGQPHTTSLCRKINMNEASNLLDDKIRRWHSDFDIPEWNGLQRGVEIINPIMMMHSARQYSQYTNWLQAAWPRGRVKNFLFSMPSWPALGPTQPPIQWVPGALSPAVKWLGHENNHSPPISAKVKKTQIYTSTPSYIFMAYCLIS